MATFGEQSMPPITTQGLITVNADLDPNIVINRQNLAASAPGGATIIGRDAVDALRLQIEEGELLFASKQAFQFGGKSMSGRRPLVFSSFNGVPVERKTTQEGFESEYIFIGMAQSATFPEGDPGGMGNGIAAKRAGSGTTMNNSTETFCPGDVIGYQLPSIDESVRAREVPSLSGARVATDRYRPNKHVARLKKITYDEINSQYDLAVARLLDSIAGADVHGFDQKTSSGQEAIYGSTNELSILIKKAYNWAFVAAIQAALTNGVVDWSTSFPSGTDAQRMKELSKRLGLLGDRGAENTKLQTDYFLLALNGSLSRTNDENQREAERLLNVYIGSAAPVMPAFGQLGGSNKRTPDLLKGIARTASYGLARSFGRCMNNFERATIATASCFAAPGNNIDYVLRP